MKKTISIVLVLILAAVCILSGCGSKKTEETKAAVETQAPETYKAETEASETRAAETAAPEVSDKEAESLSTKIEAMPDPVTTVDEPKLLHPEITRFCEGGQEKDNKHAYTMEYPAVTLPKAEAEAYPKLNTALAEDFNNYTYMRAMDVRETIASTYKSSMQQDPNFHCLSDTQSARIYRADENFLSIRLDDAYDMQGGAHADYSSMGFTYSTQDGSIIAPNNVFILRDPLIEALKIELLKIDADYFNLDEDLKAYAFDSSYRSDVKAFNMVLTYNGVLFIFNPTEIAPYASGQIQVMLSYSDYADIIRPEILALPNDYMGAFDQYVEVSTDAGRVMLGTCADEYNTINKLIITVDGQDSEFETFTYHADAYIASSKGETLLYVFQDREDDESFYQVFKIADGKAVLKETGNGHPVETGSDDVEKNQVLDLNCYSRKLSTNALTDVNSIKLEGK